MSYFAGGKPTPEEQAVHAANAWAESDSPLGSHPLHVRDAFLAGVKWARENPPRIHPDTLCPHGYRLSELQDGSTSCEGCECP